MANDVIDFVKKRRESIEKKRRSFERVMFQNFLGCYSVIDNNGSLGPIEIVDISETGMLFQVPWDPSNGQKFEKNKDLTIRIYFTKSSYLPAIVKVKYANEYTDETGIHRMRYGCEFDRDNQSFTALSAFIDFIYKFAEYSSEDRGESKVRYI